MHVYIYMYVCRLIAYTANVEYWTYMVYCEEWLYIKLHKINIQCIQTIQFSGVTILADSSQIVSDCETYRCGGITWSIIKRKHNRWDMPSLPRWALHALIPTITPKDAVTEKIMSSEEVGWQCIVCNVLLLTIQNVEISFKHFNGSWTEWTT